ncbi:hypothetical protein bcCo53_001177 (plasmid) [Borrelia coriaceae]|nr:hypothetical protein [Borrelia coriaceae]UPA17008.1 hypothetical protein bcCo53_001177 [Borrelia coriaceae]
MRLGKLAGMDRVNSDLNNSLDYNLRFASSNKFLAEQIASVLVDPNVVSDVNLKGIADDDFESDNFLVDLPSIDIELQKSKISKALDEALNFKRDFVGGLGIDGSLIKSSNLRQHSNYGEHLFADLMSSLMIRPKDMLNSPFFGNGLDGNGLNGSSRLSSDLSSNLNSRLSSDLSSKLNLDSNIFKLLSKLNSKSLSSSSNFKLRDSGVASRINDVTYDDFEKLKIERELASTGKFDTQVDINDFIRKTSGFKSLLSKVEPESTPAALFDAVKLASHLKGSTRQLEDNDDAVSVVYDLFQKGGEELSSIISDLSHLKESLSGFLDTGVSLDERLKQLLCDALLSLENADLNSKLKPSINSRADLRTDLSARVDSTLSDTRLGSVAGNLRTENLELVNGLRGDDMHMLLEELREFLSWACGLDLERNIIDPLGTYFTNVENAINSLRDTMMFNMQGVFLQNNMNDYKMGSEISRMP